MNQCFKESMDEWLTEVTNDSMIDSFNDTMKDSMNEWLNECMNESMF